MQAVTSRSSLFCRAWLGALSLAALVVAHQCPAQTGPVRFSVGDRTLFAEYRLLGREQVAVTFAFEPARTAAAAASLEKMGSQVLGRRDAIGYLYARVPIDRVESLLELQGLEASAGRKAEDLPIKVQFRFGRALNTSQFVLRHRLQDFIRRRADVAGDARLLDLVADWTPQEAGSIAQLVGFTRTTFGHGRSPRALGIRHLDPSGISGTYEVATFVRPGEIALSCWRFRARDQIAGACSLISRNRVSQSD